MSKTAADRKTARDRAAKEIAAKYARREPDPIKQQAMADALEALHAIRLERQRHKAQQDILLHRTADAIQRAAALHLSDTTIAEAVGVTRAQVWNYRAGPEEQAAKRRERRRSGREST